MKNGLRKSGLLLTSSKNDVQSSGGVLSITGLEDIRKNDITSILQINHKAEVVQVVTIGGSTPTPTASTAYRIQIGSINSKREGYNSRRSTYGFTTPAVLTTIGATAALQREYIYGKIIAQINNDSSNHVTAASSGAGAGFTLTDDAGYYPPRENGTTGGREGATEVYTLTNEDGSGFVAADNVITTAAVYGFGDGTSLLAGAPVLHAYTGNIISGELENPVTVSGARAVAGQFYAAFQINALKPASAHAVSNQLAMVLQEQIIFVDNGKGAVTTNLAGYEAFEREMQKELFGLYADDKSTVQEWFDKPIDFSDPLGVAPTGTANVLGWQTSPYGGLNRTNIGTQTIVAPVLSANGLLIDQDDTAGEGSHTSANEQALGAQSFIVGQQECSVVAKIVAADWTDAQILVGFRKKETYNADYNDYDEMAAIGSGAAAGDTITTEAILNNAATNVEASADSYTDGEAAELLITVDIDGAVVASVNGTSYPIYSAATTQMAFDAGEELIPFYQIVNIGGGDPAVEISKFVAVASKDWVF